MRRLLALLLAALLLLVTAACGGSDSGSPSEEKSESSGEIANLSVEGDFGSAPTVEVGKGVSVKEAQSEVIREGDGDPVSRGEKALLNLHVVIGKSGKKAVSTYDQGKPLAATLDDGQLFPALIEVLDGVKSGTRVAFADTVKDLYGDAGASQLGLKDSDSLVFVVDVMSATPQDVLDGPEGDEAEVPSGLPELVEEDGEITRLDFADAAKTPSDKLRVIPLVEGDGEEIDGASIVTVDYIGQVYGKAKPFNNSYVEEEPATFDVGVGGLIKAWDEGLQGQKVGSRVMLVVPPDQGYGANGNPDIDVTGKSTLVFVMDILGVG